MLYDSSYTLSLVSKLHTFPNPLICVLGHTSNLAVLGLGVLPVFAQPCDAGIEHTKQELPAYWTISLAPHSFLNIHDFPYAWIHLFLLSMFLHIYPFILTIPLFSLRICRIVCAVNLSGSLMYCSEHSLSYLHRSSPTHRHWHLPTFWPHTIDCTASPALPTLIPTLSLIFMTDIFVSD